MAKFYERLELHGTAVALVDEQSHVTYAELGHMADERGAAFGEQGKLIFIEVSNSIESIATYLGALRAGHVVYLFSKNDTARVAGLADRYRPNFIVRHSETGMATDKTSDHAHILHPDLKILLSTSGSTGSPKFVKLSADNVGTNAAAIAEYLEITPADRAATTLKPNYSYGMSVVNSHLHAGASLYLTDSSVSAPNFWPDFVAHGATGLAGVPYTFELLANTPNWVATPGLRHVTQAGGRMAPEQIATIAEGARDAGWRFYVMYGQTEASPRMAYLSPEDAITHPGAIGRAIPGGQLSLETEDRVVVEGDGVPGELIYRGPNVMMGYAEQPAHLAVDETPPALRTGDIAIRENGLYRIVGRKSRFIKLFGVRLNLDEVQAEVREIAPQAVCTGDDDRLVVALSGDDVGRASEVSGFILDRYHLPAFVVAIQTMHSVPLLGNGKPDYQALIARAAADAPAVRAKASQQKWDFSAIPSIVLSPKFYMRVIHEAAELLGFIETRWAGVSEIYETFTSAGRVDKDSTFAGLAGDSLSYVQVSLALESYLGTLPDGWEIMTVADLEARSTHESVL